MRIAEERHGPVVVLTPSGDMDLLALPRFEGRLEELLEAGVRAVLWDLGEVVLLPSTAVGFLLQSARRVRATGGRVALARVGRLAHRTLRTMGIDPVFRFHATPEEGVAALLALLEDGGG